MEAATMHGSFDQSISPHKSHLKNRKIIHRIQNPIIQTPAELFRPSHFNSTGLLQPPPPPAAAAVFLSQSFPPYTLRQSPQPPLLPLPAAPPRRSSSLSSPTVNKKPSNPHSITPKKSKSPKKVGKNSPKKSTSVIIEGDDGRMFRNGSSLRRSESVINGSGDIFSGTFFISPPPSSLPLPTFSLRCKAAAMAGVDAGATDDLRRLLRLR